MEVQSTKLDDVLLVKKSIFEDHRGTYTELYNVQKYKEHGINIEFIEDDFSMSYRNVLRGIHGDYKTWKLVSCLLGRFYLVVVDCRKRTEGFGRWEAFTLSDANGLQVLIPPGYGNAHLVLSDKAIFHYQQSRSYYREGQFTYRYDEPRFNIFWPIKEPILSERDQNASYLSTPS